MSEAEQKSEKKYLIRSANQILGPYSEEEVKGLVKEAMIATNDEAAAPCSFWLPLESHPDFKEFMDTVDIPSRLAQFLTSVSGKTLLTASKTFKDAGKTQTITEAGSGAKPAESDLSKAKEIDFEMLEGSGKPEKPSSQAPKYKPVLPEGGESAARARLQTARAIRGFWRLTAVLAVGLGVYILWSEFISSKKTEEITEDARSAGRAAYHAGDYEKAFFYFERSLAGGALPPEEKIFMASLLAHEGQQLRAESLALSLPSPPADDFRLPLLNGLIAIKEKDFSKAESIFLSALDKSPALESKKISLFNLALLKWRGGDYESSHSFLDRLMEQGFERGAAFYLRALNSAGAFAAQKGSGGAAKKNALSAIELTPEYHQELSVLLAYLHAQDGDAAAARKAAERGLGADPFFAGGYKGEYKYSSFLALDILSWERLLPYCESALKAYAESALFNSLYGFCLLKAGKLQESSQYIERARNQEPADPLILSVYVYSLLLEGSFSRAAAALQALEASEGEAAAESAESRAIAYVLKARLFEMKGEWLPAEKTWEELLQIDAYNLSALAGAAAAGFRLGNQESMARRRDRGLERYPYHVRLLSLAASPPEKE